MNGRFWTIEDLELLRRWYGKEPAAEVAARLGRSRRSVYIRAAIEGITRKIEKGRVAKTRALIARKHPLGWSDADIAAAAGCSREWISELRRSMGLPSNAHSARQRAKTSRAMQRLVRRLGLQSGADLRTEAFRQYAIESGWPEDLAPRAVAILNVLWQRGPMTRRELSDAIGMPWKGSRKSLTSNDPEGSYLATLQARGLVVRLGRCVRSGRGKGEHVNLYSIPLGVEPERNGGAKCESPMGKGRRKWLRSLPQPCPTG